MVHTFWTWLGSSVDKSVISELKPDGNSIHHVSQQSQRGGGVAIVFNSDLKIEQISNEIQFTHFQTESALFLKDLQFKEKRETSLLELSQPVL
jgi:hypothetical protein